MSRMYRLNAVVTVSTYTEVEADSLAEAIEVASQRGVEIGGPSSGVYPSESWVVDDADGEPQDIIEDKS